jgi:hypothetical protein
MSALEEKLQVYVTLGIRRAEFPSVCGSIYTISEVVTFSSSMYPQLSFDEIRNDTLTARVVLFLFTFHQKHISLGDFGGRFSHFLDHAHLFLC